MADNTTNINKEEEDRKVEEDTTKVETFSGSGFGDSSSSSLFHGFDASFDVGTFDDSSDVFSRSHYAPSYSQQKLDSGFQDFDNKFFDTYYQDDAEPQEEAVNLNQDNVAQEPQEEAIAIAAVQEPQVEPSSYSPKDAESDLEEGEIREDENVDIHAAKRKLQSVEGTSTSKERKKININQNRTNESHSSNVEQVPSQAPYYGMQQQPLFNAAVPVIVPFVPIPPLMIHQQQAQYAPIAPYGSFVFAPNINPQMQFHRGQGRGRGGRFRGRGRRARGRGRRA